MCFYELGAANSIRKIVGLDVAGNRLVRGLRREEVAQRAMISTNYCTRLEGYIAHNREAAKRKARSWERYDTTPR